MPVRIGNTAVANLKLGSQHLSRLYQGANLLWQREPVDLYLLAGQSNTQGRALESNLPPYLSGPLTGVMFRTASGWSTLDAVDNSGYPDTPTGWGPEMMLGYLARAASAGKPVFIAKYAKGGTGLLTTADPTWNPAVSGSLADLATAHFAAAYASLWDMGYQPNVYIVWGQGEEDAKASSPDQAAYTSKFAQLITSWRTVTNSPAAPVADMLVRTGYWTSPGAINQAKALAAAQLGGVTLIQSDALPDTGDQIHYNYQGQVAFGRHIYEALKSKVYPLPAAVPTPAAAFDITRQAGVVLAGPHVLSELQDSSGNARHLTQATANLRPGIYDGVLGQGFGVVRLPGGKYLTGPANPIAAGAPFAVCCLISNIPSEATGSARIVLSGGSTTGWQLFFRANTNKVLELGRGNASALVSPIQTTLGSTHLVLASYAGAAGNVMRINGATVHTSSTVVAFENAGSPLMLGASRTPDASVTYTSFTGDVTAPYLFASALTTAQMEVLEGYLTHRLGLTSLLPAGHPYKTNPPV